MQPTAREQASLLDLLYPNAWRSYRCTHALKAAWRRSGWLHQRTGHRGTAARCRRLAGCRLAARPELGLNGGRVCRRCHPGPPQPLGSGEGALACAMAVRLAAAAGAVLPAWGLPAGLVRRLLLVMVEMPPKGLLNAPAHVCVGVNHRRSAPLPVGWTFSLSWFCSTAWGGVGVKLGSAWAR